MMVKPIKLQPGERLNRNPNRPIISVQHGYLWIGNDAPEDKACYATLTGKKTLLKLAQRIRLAANKLTR